MGRGRPAGGGYWAFGVDLVRIQRVRAMLKIVNGDYSCPFHSFLR
jgi:hypothetical protein